MRQEESAMTDGREMLSEALIHQIEDCAREQNRKPVEVLEEAVQLYMAQQRLQRLAERGERLARERGILEKNVPELVQQVRRERQHFGKERLQQSESPFPLVGR